MSIPLPENDPAYFLLERGRKDPSKRSQTTVYSPKCYICNDPEFSMMGMPLCQPCLKCGGHVAADDCVCDICGEDQRDLMENNNG
jgi:hypothetical protein